jgi:hypothetical protein
LPLTGKRFVFAAEKPAESGAYHLSVVTLPQGTVQTFAGGFGNGKLWGNVLAVNDYLGNRQIVTLYDVTTGRKLQKLDVPAR